MENLDEMSQRRGVYHRARPLFSLASDCGENPKNTAQMTANNYRPSVQVVKTP